MVPAIGCIGGVAVTLFAPAGVEALSPRRRADQA